MALSAFIACEALIAVVVNDALIALSAFSACDADIEVSEFTACEALVAVLANDADVAILAVDAFCTLLTVTDSVVPSP